MRVSSGGLVKKMEICYEDVETGEKKVYTVNPNECKFDKNGLLIVNKEDWKEVE